MANNQNSQGNQGNKSNQSSQGQNRDQDSRRQPQQGGRTKGEQIPSENQSSGGMGSNKSSTQR